MNTKEVKDKEAAGITEAAIDSDAVTETEAVATDAEAAADAEEAMVDKLNKIPYTTQLFHCRMHPDCQASRKGQCIALTGWDFSIRDCPFYKNKDVNKAQQKKSLHDLMERRPDLIEKYATVLGSLGILDDEACETDAVADELEEFENELRGEAEA